MEKDTITSLDQTIGYMISADYKDRFKAEFWQLSIRASKLEHYIKRIKDAQAAGELLGQGRREQGAHAPHVLLHADAPPLGADLLGKDQGTGQRMGRRRGRPRRAVRSVLIHKAVHTLILCATGPPCYRA